MAGAGTPSGQILCPPEAIPDGGGRGFVFGEGTSRWAVFVIRRGDDLSAFVNSCPHTGTPLDWLPDRFMSADGEHIQCATHGARFRIEDGFCIHGPCAGKSLERVDVAVREGRVVLAG